MLLRLTKEFAFEMAHALPCYEGKCHNIHGHSYKLFVTIEGVPLCERDTPTDGMVLDFHALKECVERHLIDDFDHALVLPRVEGVPEPADGTLGGYAAKLKMVDFQPTTENLLLHFAQRLEGKFPPHVRLHSLKLCETDTSTAELIL